MRIGLGLGLTRSGGGGGPREINRVAPAITPTLGAELLTNGNMETGDPPADWTGSSATLASVADERTGGAGAAAMKLTATANNATFRQAKTVTAGDWFALAGWLKQVSGDATQLIIQDGLTPFSFISRSESAGASWVYKLITGRALSTSIRPTGYHFLSGGEARYDDMSFKKLTFSTCLALLGDIHRKNGTYQCTPTVAPGGQTGFLIEYLDENNFVMVIIDRAEVSTSSAYLISRIAGTYAVVKSGAITYGDGKILKVVVNGTTHQLFYDGTQVSTDGTIDNSGMGTKIYGFNTVAGNTVGTVTTSP